MEPFASIVIPAFNAESFLPVALRSALSAAAGGGVVEIIVVDDGSTDGTAALAERFLSDGAVRYKVVRQENAGPSAARNTGWNAASGDWIQFLDADDGLESRKIAVQGIEAETVGPDIACIYSTWMREERGRSLAVDPCIDVDPTLSLLRDENFLPVGACLFRREWLRRVRGFDERLRLIEDVDLELRLAMSGGRFHKAGSIDPLFTYKFREGSLSRLSWHAFMEGCERNARLAQDYWARSEGAIDGERRKLLLAIYENVLRIFSTTDRQGFARVQARVRELWPDFVPSNANVRRLSRLVGMRNAYRLRECFRTARGLT